MPRRFQDPLESLAMSDFRTSVERERPYLLRYAALQLRDRHTAEDAVQETLLAALAGEAAFAGRSNLRTWLTGILKLEECLSRLPARTAQAFMLREHLGFETDEICKELGVTATHCWVLLYRARMALRLCLEQNWFGR